MERREYNFTEKKDTRSGFGDGLYEVGSKNKETNRSVQPNEPPGCPD